MRGGSKVGVVGCAVFGKGQIECMSFFMWLQCPSQVSHAFGNHTKHSTMLRPNSMHAARQQQVSRP